MTEDLAPRSSDRGPLGRDGEAEPPADPVGRLRALVGEHFDFVWRYLRRMGVADGDADDGAQRVFLTAAERLGDIRTGSERAFLRGVALRVASHARRSYRRRGEETFDETFGEARPDQRPLPDELAEVEAGRRLVEAILDEMDLELREVFVLFEIEELSSQEIAALLDIPQGTAKSRLRRAREDFEKRASRVRAREQRFLEGGAP